MAQELTIISRTSSGFFRTSAANGSVCVTRTVCYLLLVITLVVFSLPATAAAAVKPPMIIVLPPENKTGLSSYDWLTYGIQDWLTVDLWSVPGTPAKPLTLFGTIKNYKIADLTTSEAQKAQMLGKQAGADLVWFGEYNRSGPEGLELRYSIVDVATGSIIHRDQQHGEASAVTATLSRLSANLLTGSRVEISNEQLKRIRLTKTSSLQAFQANAYAFAMQFQMFAKSGHKYAERTSWAEHGRRAVNLDPGYAEAYVNLGWAYVTDQMYDPAKNAFDTAVRLKPYLLDGWMGLGYVYRQRSEPGEAIAAFQKASVLNPALDWPREELDKLLAAAPVTPNSYQQKQTVSGDRGYQNFLDSLNTNEKKLLEQTEDRQLAVRLNAIKTLAAAKGELALPLLTRMINQRELAFVILQLIVDIDISASIPYLTEALRQRSTKVSSRFSDLNEENILGILQLINRQKLTQTIHEVEACLKDSSPAIRESAALILGDFGKPEALEPLKTMIANERSRLVRTSALVALVALGDKDGRRRLEEMFKTGDDKPAINHAIKLLRQRKLKISAD